MALRGRKKGSKSALRKSAPNTDTSGSDSPPLAYEPIYIHDHANDNVVRWGYALLLFSWMVFVSGVGGVLGVWDIVLGFQDHRIMDFACYVSLIIVTGFIWTVLNW